MTKTLKWYSHNWLVHKIIWSNLAEVMPKYAKGRLLDIGCGDKPYERLVKSIVNEYVGLERADSQHSLSKAHIIADAYDTKQGDDSFDTILSTSVLEHLEHPQEAINEIYRILKPGGHVILTCPLFWHLHEEPRDFFRFTKYGLSHMFAEAGFQILEIRALSGFLVTFTQEFAYFINPMKRTKLFAPIITLVQWTIQKIAYFFYKFDKSHDFTWLYLVIARKSEQY